MTKRQVLTTPCLKRLDLDCFRARPAWARQAFAYRLVHLLTPKALTKRLPKGLRRALLAPGVMLPPGVEMPAGIVVAPGAEIPAGWTPGDPLPPGAIAPGTAPPGVEESGAAPPTYTEIWSPGPVATAPATSPILAQWYSYTDDTYWSQVYWFFTWTGTAWHIQQGYGDGEITRNATLGWEVGFRPAKFKVTYTGPTTSFAIYDRYNGAILTIQSLTSGQEADLDFTKDRDIRKLLVSDPSPDGDVYITDFSFFA